MTPEQRRRAGRAVAREIERLGLSVAAAAHRAGVSRPALMSLIRGVAWPHDRTQDRIEDALGWRRGELVERAAGCDLCRKCR